MKNFYLLGELTELVKNTTANVQNQIQGRLDGSMEFYGSYPENSEDEVGSNEVYSFWSARSIESEDRSDDYDWDYSYDDPQVDHDIFGVGCGAKFVRLFLRNKKKVAILAGVSVSPFLLAWICSVAVFKDMVKEEKWNVI